MTFRLFSTAIFVWVISFLVSCDNGNLKQNPSKAFDTTINKITDTVRKVDIKDFKEIGSFKNNNLSIKFNGFNFSKRFTFDRYNDEWRYQDAERGNKFITSSISISSKSKDPYLPAIYAYTFNGTNFDLIGMFRYRFSRWEDYGTYLGNNADYKNDFSHTETIRFDIGLEIEEDKLKGNIIYIIARNEGCVSRDESRLGTPAVSYSDITCTKEESIYPNTIPDTYTLIKILNKQSSKK